MDDLKHSKIKETISNAWKWLVVLPEPGMRFISIALSSVEEYAMMRDEIKTTVLSTDLSDPDAMRFALDSIRESLGLDPANVTDDKYAE